MKGRRQQTGRSSVIQTTERKKLQDARKSKAEVKRIRATRRSDVKGSKL